MKKTILVLCVLVIAMTLSFSGAEAYYSSYYGGYGGLYGSSMYGGYGGLYGSMYGGYGGLYGSMYGGLYGGLYGSMYGGLYGGLGMYGLSSLYGGMYGMYGLSSLYGGMYGMYGMYGSMMSPFSLMNLFYPVETGGGLSYQVPFMQIAPLLGVAGLYNQLFPNLFNPASISTTTTTTLGATVI